MRGSDTFSRSTADRIRLLLHRTRSSPREDQKRLREQIRDLGFYISDWSRPAEGFGPSDFDALCARARSASSRPRGRHDPYGGCSSGSSPHSAHGRFRMIGSPVAGCHLGPLGPKVRWVRPRIASGRGSAEFGLR